MKPDYLNFNENYVPGQYFYVVLEGSNFLQSYVGRDRRGFARTKLQISEDGGTLTVRTLKPRKRAYNPGNYKEFRYKIVEVGTKRPTTHLPAGKIYQLFPVSE